MQDNKRFSFCYGLTRPRICLSTGLIKDLNLNELKAVLLHESYHLKNYDPLKIVIGKAASYMFFFIPILKDVNRYYVLSKEVAADNLAIKNNRKRSLISALSKIVTTDEIPGFSGVAALAGTSDLEIRISYLTNRQNKILFRPTFLNLFLSVIVLVTSFIILNSPVNAMEMDDRSMNSYFLCPYGNQCATECKNALKNKEFNFSENRLYTPVGGSPK